MVLWEMFTFAQHPPYPELDDEHVINNACDVIDNDHRTFPYMDRPERCDAETYKMMTECWGVDAGSRPSFDGLCESLMSRCDVTEDII